MRTCLWWGNPQAAAGPPPPTYATLNPSDKTAYIQLLNANLTAKETDSGNSYQGVRSTTSHDSGQYYLEFQNGAGLNANQDGIGFGDGSFTLGSGQATTLGSIASFVGTNATGVVYFDNNVLGDIGSGCAGSAVINCAAIDLTANLIWFRVGNGNWNNSPTANPALGLGGYSIAGRTPNWFVALVLKWFNNNITVNFGASAFTYTPPVGFVHW